MKGIYLTEEGKKEIEAKIAELERLEEDEFFDEHLINDYLSQIRTYQEILSSATILPVEDNCDRIRLLVPSTSKYVGDILTPIKKIYPNGVIIKTITL